MKELKLYGLYSALGMGGAYHIFWYKRHAFFFRQSLGKSPCALHAQGQGRG